MAPKGPFRLVSVNSNPERARRLVRRVVEAMKDQYEIIHIDNAEKVEYVQKICEVNFPDILFCASVWTPDESSQIQQIALETVRDVKVLVVPEGLHAKGGPDAVVAWVMKKLPTLLDDGIAG